MSDGATVQILGVAGSLRRGSFNAATLRAAQELAPAGMTIETFDIAPIPAYNDDVQQSGFPPPVEDLCARIRAADGVLIVTPEYNYSIPGVLKNAIDWASRPTPATSPLAGKPVAAIGASTGMFGAAWAQADLRKSLGLAGARVLDEELAVPGAHEAFHDDGRIKRGATRRRLAEILELLIAQARERMAASASAPS